MDLEQQANQAISRKQQAEWLITHPLFNEAFKKLEEMYFDKWLNGEGLTREEREEIWRQLKAMQHHQQLLKNLIISGELASQTLTSMRL
jgi:hypothetical protein